MHHEMTCKSVVISDKRLPSGNVHIMCKSSLCKRGVDLFVYVNPEQARYSVYRGFVITLVVEHVARVTASLENV